MINKKALTCIILLILCFNFFVPATTASPEDENPEETTVENNPETNRLIDSLMMFRFGFPYKLMENGIGSPMMLSKIYPWIIFRLQEPAFFEAIPNNIDLRYLNDTVIEIGMLNENKTDWTTNPPKWPLADREYYTFDLELPEGIPEDAIQYHFYPNNILVPGDGKKMKVDLRLETQFPDDYEVPDQFSLTVNITRFQVINNLLKNAFEMQKGISGKLYFATVGWPFWTPFLNVQGTNKESIYVDLTVREDRFHLLEVKPSTKKYSLGLDEMKQIPVEIKNKGSHRDTFNFEVEAENEGNLDLAAPNSVTLDPYEEKTVYVTVGTPRVFNDPGTLHSIKVSAYSVYQEDKVFNNTVSVVTEGVYVSAGSIVNTALTTIVVLLAVAFLWLKRSRISEFLSKKPAEEETKETIGERETSEEEPTFESEELEEEEEVEEPPSETEEEEEPEEEKKEEPEEEETEEKEETSESEKEEEKSDKKREKEKAIERILREQQKQRERFNKY
ncbi:MAG: hypothetical protein V5A64_00870 [Candidatus Thermoplasmatota archaeon]